jgi:hypothetical protein
MSFVISELIHIVSTVDDLLSMSEPPSNISISTGCDENEEDDCEDEEIFIKLSFALKNSYAEIKMYDSIGVFAAVDHNGELLKDVDFDDSSISETNGSFKKALKQIRDFDRQYVGQLKNTHVPIDRASFGLAEVN